MSTADPIRRPAPGLSLALALALAHGLACANGEGDQRGGTPSAPATVAAATNPPAAPAPAASGSAGSRNMESLTIESNTQATIDDVRIGVGNIWEEDYTDESGAKKKGLTAMMQIFVRDDSGKNLKKRVHPGQKLPANRFEIEVKAVEENAVRVVVHDAKKP